MATFLSDVKETVITSQKCLDLKYLTTPRQKQHRTERILCT